MLPENERFFCNGEGVFVDAIMDCWVYDIDQRRWLTVRMPRSWNTRDDDADELWHDTCEKAKELAALHVDEISAQVKRIDVDKAGGLSFLTQVVDDMFTNLGNSTYSPPLVEYQLPRDTTKTLLRSDLTELDRLATHVDLVSYAGMEEAIFKYSHYWKGFGPTWQEIHIHARLPRHPNILPLDCLVLDEISGARVVGFTAPFIAGGDLDRNKTRPFKLKYLQQLMQVVDDLNYKFGIVHNDVAPRNLLIDPATDNLVLFDFNVAAKIGKNDARYHLGETTVALKERNDVKGVVLTLHEILTRDARYGTVPPPKLHMLDETDLLAERAADDKWVQHPDVELDPGLGTADYVAELARWVRARGARPIASFAEASQPLDWPTHMRDPPGGLVSYNRQQAVEHGLPFVEWVRPRWAHIDRSRRLLATGRYADDGGEVVPVPAADGVVRINGAAGPDMAAASAKSRTAASGKQMDQGDPSRLGDDSTSPFTDQGGRRRTRRRKKATPGRDKKGSRFASSSSAKRKTKGTVAAPSEGLRRSPRLRGRTSVVYCFG